ncbi:MAG: hypothetical protein A4E35_02336 [Methanoregula sp. PtaU1.Bin051]|nr:MAG: hypothetical protein A4E35_02336 [Methanoregula sp. PtaU1.Bin051]
MLMLAVTIMLAAIVSTYAGGFSDVSEKPPQSTLTITANLRENRTYFTHAGGDPFSLSGIQVVFKSGENKTTLTRADIGGNCINFTQLGSHEMTIRAGDTFYLEGADPYDDDMAIRFGKLVLRKNSEITWMVIDSRSSKTIAMGSLFL